MRRKLTYSPLLSVSMLVGPASAFANKSVNGVRVLTTIDELVDPKHTLF